MRMQRQVMLSAFLFAALVATTASAGEGDARLPDTVIPIEETIDLTIDPAILEYKGQVKLTVRITAPTAAVEVHAVDLRFTKVRALHDGVDVPVAPDRVVGTRHQIVIGKDPKGTPPGTYVLEIDFTGKQSTQAIGLYRAAVDGQSYTLTQFEGDYARNALPCFDEPGAKIPYRVTVHVPRDAVAVSNTPIESQSVDATAKTTTAKTVVFRKTPPLPSYLLALAVGPFDAQPIEGMGVPGNVYTVRGKGKYAKEVAAVTAPVVHALEKYFGRKYPYEKLDFIAAPEFLYGGMENPGAIVYRDARILLRPEDVTPMSRNRLVELIGHEIAHIWFGDLVTMKWWDDLWLNESFASWMEPKILDEVAPDLRASLSSVRSTDFALRTDSRKTTRAIRRPVAATDNFENLIDELTYNKGQAVLEMFESYLGRAKFQAGVVSYINAFAWKSTVADDLWKKLGEATGVDVGRAMSTFLDQSGAPLITVKLLGKGRVRIEQRRLGPGPATRWIVPIVLKYSDFSTVRQKTVLLDQPAVELDLGSRLAWVHPNVDEHGYYRWQVPTETMTALLASAPRDLSVRERLGLIANTEALVRLGLADVTLLFDVVKKLAADPDPRVELRLVDELPLIELWLNGTPLAADFDPYARALIAQMRARQSSQPTDGEKPDDSNLRAALLELACDFGDPTALAYGKSELVRYWRDPKSVHPTLVSSVLNCAAFDADDATFEQLRTHFEKADSPLERERYLLALKHSRKQWSKFLDYVLTGPVRPQEGYRALLGDREPARREAFAFVRAHYHELAQKIPASFRASIPEYVLPSCDADTMKEAHAFFSDASRHADGIEETLAKLEDETNECTAVRVRQRPLFEKALRPAHAKTK